MNPNEIKLKKITFHNFRGFQDIEIDFDEQLTILAGINGSGKTTVLDAIAIMLSWIISRIRSSGSSGRPIMDLDINNQFNSGSIQLQTITGNRWTKSKTKKGHKKKIELPFLGYVSKYAKSIQERISDTNEKCSIPVFVYYPTNRVVIDIPLRIRTSHSFSLLETYEGSLTGGANFRHFFEWFHNRENLENENFKHKDNIIKPENWSYPDPQLNSVRQSLHVFLPGFTDFSVRRHPLCMIAKKNGQEIRIDQLSDGEKCIIALIGDLARRLAIANPTLENSLHGEGIVLIDEIELHCHPEWQRMIIQKLPEVFPNCQFILSTHSPQSIGEVPGKSLRLLYNEEGIMNCYTPNQALGLDSSEILEEIMHSRRRNSSITEQLASITSLIDEEQFDKAKEKIENLKIKINGSIPEIVHAESMMTMMEAVLDD